MIVGARIAIPPLIVAVIGWLQTPHLIKIGWLHPGDHYRRIGFIISLGGILGAAVLDLALILIQTARRWTTQKAAPAAAPEDWKRVNAWRLMLWPSHSGPSPRLLWGTGLLHQPVKFLVIAIALCFVFVLVNRHRARRLGL